MSIPSRALRCYRQPLPPLQQRPNHALRYLHGLRKHDSILPANTSRALAARHAQWPLPRTISRRESTDTSTGDEDSGHVEAKYNERLFFLDNLFPLKLNFLMGLPFKSFMNINQYVLDIVKRVDEPERAAASPERLAEQSIPDNRHIKVEEVLPRLGDGGAFVKFSYGAGQDPQKIEKSVREHLRENPIKPWFSPFSQARASLVRGVPWLEDLHRVPSQCLKAEFVPPEAGEKAEELSEETLYTLFRKYGRLRDIVPQAQDSKELPRYAVLDFSNARNAIMAKMCMHGYTVNASEGGGKAGTVIKLTYQHRKKAHYIWDWLMNHPRITLPLLAALVGTLAVTIFDPIRTFSIKAHITRSFHISDNKIFKWFVSQATKANELLNLSRFRTENRSLSAIWDDRKDTIGQIQTWLMETADTFIVIQGPRGSGKKELVMDQALKHRKNTVLIDCKPIQEARGDGGTIRAAAIEVNYRPVFSWMNSMSSLIDLAAQGTIGTKTGLSETLETQLQKIWQSTTGALREIALEGRSKKDKDANLGADEYLEAHPEKRPVVVIDNFLHKSQENSVVYDKIAEWAATLTTTNIAHVIFLTNDVSYSKSLSKALPDRIFRQISLGDCSPEVAKRFVINHLDADSDDDNSSSSSDSDGTTERKLPPSQLRSDLKQLDDCISILGGRLTDLEFLARRIKAGEAPHGAVQEIIDQSASEILKMYIWDAVNGNSNSKNSSGNDNQSRPWTAGQAWQLIKSLAANDTIKYNELLLNSTYSLGPEGEHVLSALEQAELITIQSSNGRPTAIKPGRPVYTAAFKALTSDAVLSARLDLAINEQQRKTEGTNIASAEDELNLLGQIAGANTHLPGACLPRARYLLDKLRTSQANLEALEKQANELKAVLKREF